MKIKHLEFALCLILFIGIFYFNNNVTLHAYSNSIEELAEQYTNSDGYIYNGQIYDISDYVSTWNGFNIGRGGGYGQRNIQTSNSYRYDDNDIVNIIPKDLFYTEGTYHYIGKEYGFYINTELVNNGYNYRNYVAVYDIDYEIPDIFSNTTTCNIEVLFNCWYDSYFRASRNPFGNIIVEGKDKAVTFLSVPTSNNDIITLTDIGVNVSLENRDFLNPGDEGYSFKDPVKNKLIDKGDFILNQTVEVNPKVMPVENKNDLNWKEKLFYFVCKKIIEKTEVLSPLLWLEYLDPNMQSVILNNNSYSRTLRYGSAYEQLFNDNYIRMSGANTNSLYSDDYNPEFHTGDSFKIITEIGGDRESESRISMNLFYDISISVKDPKTNSVSTAQTRTNRFNYSKYMKVTQTDLMSGAKLDSETGKMVFYYYSENNDLLSFIQYSEYDTVTTVYDENEEIVATSEYLISISEPGMKMYIIEVKGIPGSNISFTPCKDYSKFLNLSVDLHRVSQLKHDTTTLIFDTFDFGNSDYSFYFNCDDLVGDSIEILDIYGNVLVEKFIVTRKDTYLKAYLPSNNYYKIEISKSNNIEKELTLLVNNMNSINYTLEFGIDSTNPVECSIIENGYDNFLLKYYVTYDDVYIVSLLSDNNISIPNGSIKLYDSNMNLIKRIDNSLIDTFSQNSLNDKDFIVYLSSGYYYISLDSSSLSAINLGVCITGLSESYQFIDEDYYVFELFNDYDYFIKFNPQYNGDYKFNIEYNSLNSDLIVILYKRNAIYDIQQIETIILESNSEQVQEYIFSNVQSNDEYYICIYSNTADNNILFEFERIIVSSFSVILDPKNITDSSLLGTEVSLNQGEKENNNLTVGYTRCCFVYTELGSDSRLNYNWFSSDPSVAIISQYGTITGVAVGETIINVVSKSNPSSVYKFLVVVNDDESNIQRNVMLTTDMRSVQSHNGTEVTILNQDAGLNTIHVGYTRALCFESGNPSNSIQDFIWVSSNNNIATVTSYGVVKGISEGEVLITGYYKYNDNFVATIRIVVV